jgi:hypothetical protein
MIGPTRRVDDDKAGLRRGKRLGSEQSARLAAERRMHRHHVGPRQQFVERVHPLVTGRQVDAREQVRIVEHYLHVEGGGPARGGEPDTAEPDDTERSVLVPPDQRCLGEMPALEPVDGDFGRVAVGAAGQRQHQRDRVVGHFGGAVIRHVAGRNIAGAPAGGIDIVEADTRAHRDLGIGKRRRRQRHVQCRRVVDHCIDGLGHLGVEHRRDIRRRAGKDELDIRVVLAFQLGIIGGLPVDAQNLHRFLRCPRQSLIISECRRCGRPSAPPHRPAGRWCSVYPTPAPRSPPPPCRFRSRRPRRLPSPHPRPPSAI